MILDKNTWGDSTQSKCLSHLVDVINTMEQNEQKKVCSLIDRKIHLIDAFSSELQSYSLRNYVHKQLFNDIKNDFNAMAISSEKVKTLAINFLVAKLRTELLNER
jgi:hypothetical protein